MNAAAYIRVSTDDQIEFSPASQLNQIHIYAENHQLLLLDSHIYMDEGISGRTAARRPAFLKMISAARETPRPFDMILVWKYSRFARSRQDSIFYKSLLRRECGIDVISITEPLSDDPTSILMEALLEAMDEYYSVNLGQEVRRGMRKNYKRGGVVSISSLWLSGRGRPFYSRPSKSPLCVHDLSAISSWKHLSGNCPVCLIHAASAPPAETHLTAEQSATFSATHSISEFCGGRLIPLLLTTIFYETVEMTYAQGTQPLLISPVLI